MGTLRDVGCVTGEYVGDGREKLTKLNQQLTHLQMFWILSFSTLLTMLLNRTTRMSQVVTSASLVPFSYCTTVRRQGLASTLTT